MEAAHIPIQLFVLELQLENLALKYGVVRKLSLLLLRTGPLILRFMGLGGRRAQISRSLVRRKRGLGDAQIVENLLQGIRGEIGCANRTMALGSLGRLVTRIDYRLVARDCARGGIGPRIRGLCCGIHSEVITRSVDCASRLILIHDQHCPHVIRLESPACLHPFLVISDRHLRYSRIVRHQSLILSLETVVRLLLLHIDELELVFALAPEELKLLLPLSLIEINLLLKLSLDRMDGASDPTRTLALAAVHLVYVRVSSQAGFFVGDCIPWIAFSQSSL